MTPSAGLNLEDVVLRYAAADAPALRGVSISVASGEVVCLLGPSGCGKTSCLRLAAGLERPNRGRILVGGTVVADAADGRFVPPEKRRVGLVLQDFALFPHLTVSGNLAFGLKRRSRGERAARIADLLHQVSLSHKADAYPHELSGGEQQRVALARALAPDPAVMLMDEPFSSLDVTLRADVRAATLHVLAGRQVPTLIVTHDPEEAMALADRIIVMRDGQVVQDGTPEAIYFRPADSFVMTFLGRTNTLICPVADGRVATPFAALPVPPDVVPDPDGRVRVLVRAGDVKPVDAGDAHAVQARVLDVRLIGSVQQVKLALAEAGVEAMMEADRTFSVTPGETIHVRTDPANLRCFTLDAPAATA